MIKLQTLGADPEVFLLDENQTVVSAINKIGGTKEAPRAISDTTLVQEDNVLLEFNIKPATSQGMFLEHMEKALLDVKKILPTGHDILNIASYDLPTEELASVEAWMSGCAPTVNAWTRKVIPNNGFTSGVRTSSGHIHIGYERPQRGVNLAIAKACDLFLGVPSVIMDADRERRKYYGVAGEIRHKPYGVEYRTLSSFWINDPVLCEWVWQNVERATAYLNKYGASELNEMRDDLRGAIDTYDTKLCNQLIKYSKSKL